MKFTHFWLQPLAIFALASVAWTTPSLANEVNTNTVDTEYFQEEEPIEIEVPVPENNTAGTCSAVIEPALDSIIGRYQNNWGILVEKLEDGTLLYSHNPDQKFIPASNNKIFTTAAALSLLSPQSKVGSKSLREWVNVTNVRSNNYYADTLLRHIGGPQAAKKALTQLGVNPSSFSQVDGSGLSRRNVATPRALVTTLRAMYYTPARDVFYTSLPVAGVTGTLRNRMKSTPAQGAVHAKTGTLKGVRALSGYMNHPYFGMVVFSILANNFSVSGSALIGSIDKIVLQLSTVRPCD
ncbi:D-alanyl-D-alanine carboxypeptidase [Crocosphaera sp. UHCC 0190]|uniref:D-alanyl-D-alanine carboxypeptidase n=1 Tax=Crocosphaera sp. UHCC 0190 TaxID=3110246 RepID=UPI002B21329B|nr:D-alanyl-D-alanine carboxypeptidase [Crocosphaera sp. UHCC 0190]MEA5511573.1 D-alanyl-D-alanine carboxypeptidase [Crocosphaera sp. UHCC 0190]